MTFQRLPRPIFDDILELILEQDESVYCPISSILNYRLINRFFNAEITHAVFDRDTLNLHTRTAFLWPCPKGRSLSRFVRGFVTRPETSNAVLNNLRTSLRDGVLILSVLLASVADSNSQNVAPATNEPISMTDKYVEQSTKLPTVEVTEKPTDEGLLPEDALTSICDAYTNFLGDDFAYKSLDSTWDRNPADFKMLNDKIGHFWCFIAACLDGRPHLVRKAAKACSDHITDESEDFLAIKTIFAAGLVIAAKNGNTQAIETVLEQPRARISLRFQSLRFPEVNAMEAAIGASQTQAVEYLLDRGWNLTTVPLDYLQSLKVAISDMKDSPTRTRLLKDLLQGNCQQWQSDHIVIGVLQALSLRGDLENCQMIKSLLQDSKSPRDSYRWKWELKDNRVDENQPTTAVEDAENNIDEDAELEMIAFPASIEQKSPICLAMANGHYHMVPFIMDNRSLFPQVGDLSEIFGKRCMLNCFEDAIREQKNDALDILMPYISVASLDAASLFIYAVCHGNLHAVKILLPFVELKKPPKEDFWSFQAFDGENSDMDNTINRLRDHTNPGGFLFQIYHPQHTDTKLGTFALVVAIKAIKIEVTQFLLEQGCQIGTRLILIAPNLIKLRTARVFFPNEGSIEPPKRLTIFKWWGFDIVDLKRMIEMGAPLPQRTPRWWHRWLKLPEYNPDARIIAAISTPTTTYSPDGLEPTQDELDRMCALLRRYRMPRLYIPYDGQ